MCGLDERSVCQFSTGCTGGTPSPTSVHSAASAKASASVGCTNIDSTMSTARSLPVTATANTEISSDALRPTMGPTQDDAGCRVGHDFTNPRGSLSMRARALAANGTFVTRIFRPSAKASVSANPTSAISGSVKTANGALS